MTADTVDAYAAWMRSWGASPKTIRARAEMAEDLLTLCGGVKGITAEKIQQRLAEPNRHNGARLSAWSLATYHGHLREFCAWLVATNRLPEDPMRDVKRPGKPKSLPRPLTEEQVSLVLERASGRVRDWINLALLAGLRAHEIAKIAGEDVSAESIYVQGKGGVRAAIPTHAELWEMAQSYPRRGHWFPGRKGHITGHTVTVTVSEFFDSLGIDGSIHRARHTYGTRLLRAGVNIRVVQTLMRHANVETTAVYTAVDEDERRAAISLL